MRTFTDEHRRKLSEAHKGPRPYRRGIPIAEEVRRRISEKLKGRPLSEETKLKMKGRTPWNKGNWSSAKKRPTGLGILIEEKSPNWKGQAATYSTLHWWIRKHKGNPDVCVHCGVAGKKNDRRWNLEWANVDQKYMRDLDDYIGLCQPCHTQYDLPFKRAKKK